MTDPTNPVSTHTFEFISGTGDRDAAPGTDHFRCVHCNRDLYESGIRAENGAFRRGTITESGAAALHPCERPQTETAQEDTR